MVSECSGVDSSVSMEVEALEVCTVYRSSERAGWTKELKHS